MAEFGVLAALVVVLAVGVGGLVSSMTGQEGPAEPPVKAVVAASSPVAAPPAAAVPAVAPPAPANPAPAVVAVVRPPPAAPVAPKVVAPEAPAAPTPAVVLPALELPAAPVPEAAVEDVAPVEPPVASLTSPLPQRKPAVPKVANAPTARLTVKECLRRYNQAISSTSAQYNRLLAREGPSRSGRCRAIRQARELMRDVAKEQSACLQLAGMERERREAREHLQDFDQDVREFCG